MTFVILCMCPLLSPHVTYYQTQQKLSHRIKEQLAADYWYATFYEDLLSGKRNWDSLPFETSEPINEPKGTYTIGFEQEKSGAKGESYFLKLIITPDSENAKLEDPEKPKRVFTYYFVVTRKTDENQKEAPNPT